MNIAVDINFNNVAPNHIFITSSKKPKVGIITYTAQLVSNQYLGQNLSVKKWRAFKNEVIVSYNEGPFKGKLGKPLNYNIISKSIREESGFFPEKFGLMDHHCDWMDGTMEVRQNFHMSDQTGVLGIASGDLQDYYGQNYPIKPQLQREGRLYTSFQPQLIQRIIKDRTVLIENSANALLDEWVFDLRNLISNVISLVEIGFTQLYIKAEFDPLPGWNFSKEKLGERHGRRMKDKFKWIYQITGNNPNVEGEFPSFENLRKLRNHLMHFDPPSFVVTLEEATLWLNQIIDVGLMLIKIRIALGVPVSADLINLSLQHEAVFVPGTDNNRTPISDTNQADYASSTWWKSDSDT